MQRLQECPQGISPCGHSCSRYCLLPTSIVYCLRALPSATARVLRLPGQLVESDVQGEDVHPGLAEDAEVAALGVLVDKRLDLGDRQVPCRRDPRDLDVRVLRGYVR